MRKIILQVSAAILLSLGIVQGLSEGDQCTKLGKVGTCVHILNCTSALDDVKNNIFPKICSVIGEKHLIVCCFDSTNVTQYEDIRPIFIGVDTKSSLDTEKVVEKNTTKEGHEQFPGCPIPNHLTTNKTGQIAWDKCIEYQHRLIFQCVREGLLQKCAKVQQESLVIGSNGVDANPYEFSHMALLGFGNQLNESEWLCGGTVISEKYVLTAGHCVSAPNRGNVTRIATGILKISDVLKSGQIYNVRKIVTHPKYKSPSKYNDIALLETDEIRLSKFLVPACLHTGLYSDHADQAIATGWGALWYKGARPDILQKMDLKEFSKESCQKQYNANRLLKNGYDVTTQLCYGDPLENTDTCDGDSGGPLQITHPNMYCMHLVIGVTSFGIHCGVVNKPAVYTRVEPYIPWIESVVWPEK